MSRERLEPAAISPLERQLRSAAAASSSQDKPQILPVGTSPLLSQLKQFLPKMEAANAELQQKLQECDPAELDIEHIPEQQGEEGEGAGQVIQMDLACGLLELHDEAAVAAAQRAIAAGGDIAFESYDGGSSSDDDSSGSSSDDGDDPDGGGESEGGGTKDGLKGVGEVSRGAAAAGSSRRPAAAADAAAAAAAAGVGGGGDAMEEDDKQEQPAAAAGREQQHGQGQQQQGKQQRRKLKPRKPMIVELS